MGGIYTCIPFHWSVDKPGGEEAGNFSCFIIVYKLDQSKTPRLAGFSKVKVWPFLCREHAQRNSLPADKAAWNTWGHYSHCIL